MPCNCPGSGCACVEASSTTIAVTGSGSLGNPYVHTAIISADACNQISAVADGLLVPGLVPTTLNVTSGNLLVQHAGCGVDTLVDPPANRVLRGNPAGTTDASWRPFISEGAPTNYAYAGADGGVRVDAPGAGTTLPPGGGVCQFLGNSALGVPAWVNPNLAEVFFYTDVAVAGQNVAVPADAVFHQLITPLATYTNNSSCSEIVLMQVTSFLEVFPDAPLADMVWEHTSTLIANRDRFGAVVNISDVSGHVGNQRSSTPLGQVAIWGKSMTWSKVLPGDTVIWSMQQQGKNNGGVDPGSFYTEIQRLSIVRWRV